MFADQATSVRLPANAGVQGHVFRPLQNISLAKPNLSALVSRHAIEVMMSASNRSSLWEEWLAFRSTCLHDADFAIAAARGHTSPATPRRIQDDQKM